MKIITRIMAASVATLLLFGCGKDSPLTGADESGIEVTGYLTASLIHTTSTQPLSADTPVALRIIGLAGAATNLAEVKATNTRSGESQTASVQAEGSFELSLMALKTDSLTLVPVGVDTEESVSIDVQELHEFPALEEDGIDISYAMETLEECEPFVDDEADDGESGDGEDWDQNWGDGDFDPQEEADCELALIQVLLAEPLSNGQLIAVNSELNLVEALESENEQSWFGTIRALHGDTLWLIYEKDDGSWSTSFSISVP